MTELEQAVVVVPAHNELEHLPRCLLALTTASRRLTMPVLMVVVLDACDDGSDSLAEQFGPDVRFVSIDAGNVGAARAAGFEYARSVCGSVEPERTWFATTDADSVVSGQWLARMTMADADSHDPTQAIEIPLPGIVPDVLHLSLHQHQWLLVIEEDARVQILLAQRQDLFG